MRRFMLFFTLTISLVAVLVMPMTANASSYYYGTGISTCAELQAIDDDANSYSSAFYLENNIDCEGQQIDPLKWDTNFFAGTFDGNNFTISNYSMDNGNQPVGLFQEIHGATILDLKISDVDVTTSSIAGTLAGIAKTSTITNVHTESTTTSTGFASGGLVGQSEDSTIDGSSSTGAVNAFFLGGGLVGYQNSLAQYASVIKSSWSNATVNAAAGYGVGGLVGQASSYGYGENATILISDSYSTGTVFAPNTVRVGGLVGLFTAEDAAFDAESIIQRSYSSSNVTGDEEVGGLIGTVSDIDDVDVNISILDSFATGLANGNVSVAGFIGRLVQSDHSIVLSNNLFGSSTGWLECVSNVVVGGCDATPNQGGNAGHFKGNDTVAPFADNRWNFDGSDWEIVDGELPQLIRDIDEDGVTSTIERSAPNSGDANDDATQDSQQDDVASFEYIGEYQSLSTSNGSLQSVNPQSRVATDGYEFPFGIIRFLVKVNAGQSTQLEVTIFTDDSASDYVPVKFSDSEGTVRELDDAVVSEGTIDGSHFIKIVYNAVDGGINDEDGVENGLIVDPVSMAVAPAAQVTTTTSAATTTTQVIAAPGSTTSAGNLPITGSDSNYALRIGLTLILMGSLVAIVFRRRFEAFIKAKPTSSSDTA